MQRRRIFFFLVFLTLALAFAGWTGCTGDIKSGTQGNVWLALRMDTISIGFLLLATISFAVLATSFVENRVLQLAVFLAVASFGFGYGWNFVIYAERFATKACF